MNTKTKHSVESSLDSATSTTSTTSNLMTVQITPDVKKNGTGEFHMVYSKKDLSGKISRMEKKTGDKVVNKGEIVKDSETGLDVYLIRVHRGKRVWYGKGIISEETGQVAVE